MAPSPKMKANIISAVLVFLKGNVCQSSSVLFYSGGRGVIRVVQMGIGCLYPIYFSVQRWGGQCNAVGLCTSAA